MQSSSGERGAALAHARAEQAHGQTHAIVGALAHMALFSFKQFTDTTFRLLHCVPVCVALSPRDGGGMSTAECADDRDVLFYAGGTDCGTAWLP